MRKINTFPYRLCYLFSELGLLPSFCYYTMKKLLHSYQAIFDKSPFCTKFSKNSKKYNLRDDVRDHVRVM